MSDAHRETRMSERHAKACEAGALALDRIKPETGAARLLRELAGRLKAPKRETAKQPQSYFATQKEEITRKALGAVADAQARFEAGELTGRDLWVAVDAIHDTVSGLIDPDMTLLIYRARQELKEHATR
ncbi:hypothetical protein FV222_00340 [Methylobacterium sp. WL103]|uniref:hypothetical protein n=1 Tax=Methylobacterium sp. WL103 TaxID=2603891 RepID=UPI0011C8611F|nr:hypothetical protein [Methylobacterium sp. WL103]TXN08953.1 hypothetical protein FV222_00340 [Methylobacterium sp. WL103]